MLAKTIVNIGALCAIIVLCSGCAITRVEDGNGHAKTTYTLLAPVSAISIPSDGAYVETKGVGVVSVGGQTSIGLYDMSVLGLSPDCRLVVITASDAELKAWRDVLKDVGPICGKSQPRREKTP